MPLLTIYSNFNSNYQQACWGFTELKTEKVNEIASLFLGDNLPPQHNRVRVLDCASGFGKLIDYKNGQINSYDLAPDKILNDERLPEEDKDKLLRLNESYASFKDAYENDKEMGAKGILESVFIAEHGIDYFQFGGIYLNASNNLSDKIQRITSGIKAPLDFWPAQPRAFAEAVFRTGQDRILLATNTLSMPKVRVVDNGLLHDIYITGILVNALDENNRVKPASKRSFLALAVLNQVFWGMVGGRDQDLLLNPFTDNSQITSIIINAGGSNPSFKMFFSTGQSALYAWTSESIKTVKRAIREDLHYVQKIQELNLRIDQSSEQLCEAEIRALSEDMISDVNFIAKIRALMLSKCHLEINHCETNEKINLSLSRLPKRLLVHYQLAQASQGVVSFLGWAKNTDNTTHLSLTDCYMAWQSIKTKVLTHQTNGHFGSFFIHFSAVTQIYQTLKNMGLMRQNDAGLRVMTSSFNDLLRYLEISIIREKQLSEQAVVKDKIQPG